MIDLRYLIRRIINGRFQINMDEAAFKSNSLDLITQRRDLNFDVLEMISSYLINHPRFITAEMMGDMLSSSSLPVEDAYRLLLSAALGLDPSANDRDRRISAIRDRCRRDRVAGIGEFRVLVFVVKSRSDPAGVSDRRGLAGRQAVDREKLQGRSIS